METDSGVNSSNHSLENFTSGIEDEDGKSLSELSVSKHLLRSQPDCVLPYITS